MKEWINILVQCGKPGQFKQTKLEIQLSHIFPLYSEDYLKLMILFQDSKQTSRAALTDSCRRELLHTATEELLLVLHVSNLDPRSKEQLSEQWYRYHADTFDSYLQTFCTDKS